MSDFAQNLKDLLMSPEYGYTEKDAGRLLKAYPDVVISGILAGKLRVTAMALEMKEEGDG